MRNLTFEVRGWEDYQHWIQMDRKMLKRLNALIADVMRHPFEGIGSPEPLKHDLGGCHSRRINQEHRLVYRATEDSIIILAARYHY